MGTTTIIPIVAGLLADLRDPLLEDFLEGGAGALSLLMIVPLVNLAKNARMGHPQS